MDRQRPKRSILGWVRDLTRRPKKTERVYQPDPKPPKVRPPPESYRVDMRTLPHRDWLLKRTRRRIARDSRRTAR